MQIADVTGTFRLPLAERVGEEVGAARRHVREQQSVPIRLAASIARRGRIRDGRSGQQTANSQLIEVGILYTAEHEFDGGVFLSK